MARNLLRALVTLVPCAVPLAAVAQQAGNAPPQYYPPPAPSYQAPPTYYPPPPAASPAPAYQPPTSYPPPPNQGQPASAPRPQGYPASANYPAPQPSQQVPAYAPAPQGYYPQPAGAYPPGAGYPQPVPVGPSGAVGDQVPPYHVHRDVNHGHDHVYPDRGSVIRDLPHGAVLVNYAGMTYQFADGVWFEPRGPAYLVVEPPIGVIVSTLPQFMTALNTGNEIILYGNDTFYRPRPDIGGYEVVNDPIDSPPQQASAAGAVAVAAAAPMAVAAAAPSPAPAVPAASPTPTPAAKSPDQQARDQYECYRFAVSQTGFDPMRANSAQAATQQSNYERAHSACLEGRGYPPTGK